MTKKIFKVVTSLALLAVVACSPTTQKSAVHQQIDSAKSANNTLFVVVSDDKNSGADLVEIISSATKDISNIEIIEVNASDKESAAFINEQQLVGAPYPLVLVMSDRGVMMGGLLANQVTAESVVDAIPTPKLSEISYILNQDLAVIINVTSDKFAHDKATKELCAAIVREHEDSIGVVTIDVEDEDEAKLMMMLNLGEGVSDSHITVINAQGMVIDQYSSLPTQAAVVTAAQTVLPMSCTSGECGHNH